MAWIINAGLNEGYPTNTEFIDVPTGWTNNIDDIWYPASLWRIDPNYNEGYPFTWWHIALADDWLYKTDTIGEYPSESTGGEMQIGGSQSNYPNGFTTLPNGIPTGMTDGSMITDITASPSAGLVSAGISIATGADRILAMSMLESGALYEYIRSTNIFTDIENAITNTVFSQLCGGNIYESIIATRVFPFAIDGTMTPVTVRLFGIVPVKSSGVDLTSQALYTLNHIFNMGTLDISSFYDQGWQFENCEWYIYLPMAGTFTLDLRSDESLQILLAVDYLSGVGEYMLFQNGNLLTTYKAQLGVDVPVNTTQGNLMNNFVNNVTPIITKGAGLAASALGAPGVGMAIDKVGSLLSNDKHAVSTPSIGGNAGSYCYKYPRLICKMPVMHNSANGYPDILGQSHEMTYSTLSDIGSGFVKCNNYKSNIIVATDDEKAEIERRMNEGVFI